MSPRRVDKEERRNEILEAAITVFSENGYHASRVDDIASRAGVSKGTIYLYFDSRESILLAAFDHFMEQLRDAFDHTLGADATPMQRLHQILDLSFEQFKANQTLGRVLFDFWSASMYNPDLPHLDFKKMYGEFRDLLVDLLNDAEQVGEIRVDRPALTANFLMAIVDGITLHWMMDPNIFPVENLTEQLMTFITDGIAVR
ncbi:MAG: TetR family transcriptional regulator [Bacteroidetes bacterium]|nr:TetR family transcriptional regulator [Bacteroidota bacterium]